MGPVAPPTGFDVSAALAGAIQLLRPVLGEGVVAIVLAGSHASGEAVWALVHGRQISLSDLDLYVILSERSACRVAEQRVRAAQDGLRALLAALGFVSPLEVGFLTRAGLSQMAAKPGVIELRRSGRVLEGDASVLEAVPPYGAADVSAEECQLLLENRGFELLLAAPGVARDAVDRLGARHAVHKTALDLAGVLALRNGEWPHGHRGRVQMALGNGLQGARARASQGYEAGIEALPALWDSAFAFRALPAALEGDATQEEWQRVARAWAAIWSDGRVVRASDPWDAIVADAARAPLRRRLRQAVSFRSRLGPAPDLFDRLRHAQTGTPQHRIHASATVLLHAAALSARVPMLPAGALRALAALGITRAQDWEAARNEVTRAWDQWLQSGLRTGERA